MKKIFQLEHPPPPPITSIHDIIIVYIFMEDVYDSICKKSIASK